MFLKMCGHCAKQCAVRQQTKRLASQQITTHKDARDNIEAGIEYGLTSNRAHQESRVVQKLLKRGKGADPLLDPVVLDLIQRGQFSLLFECFVKGSFLEEVHTLYYTEYLMPWSQLERAPLVVVPVALRSTTTLATLLQFSRKGS